VTVDIRDDRLAKPTMPKLEPTYPSPSILPLPNPNLSHGTPCAHANLWNEFQVLVNKDNTDNTTTPTRRALSSLLPPTFHWPHGLRVLGHR
jgi:hypothetical protein